MNSLVINRISDIAELDAQQPVEIACNNWAEYPRGPRTTFKMGLLPEAIAIKYAVEEDNPRAVNHNDQEPVWEDSCVEFFCRVPGDEHYFNFEFNSLGVCVCSRRLGRKEDVNPLGPDQLAQVRRRPGSQPGLWTLEVEIPLALVLPQGVDELPAEFEANLYKCGDRTVQPHYLSWSPIALPKPDFHCPAHFGRIAVAGAGLA